LEAALKNRAVVVVPFVALQKHNVVVVGLHLVVAAVVPRGGRQLTPR
jgi:hypothetical protein